MRKTLGKREFVKRLKEFHAEGMFRLDKELYAYAKRNYGSLEAALIAHKLKKKSKITLDVSNYFEKVEMREREFSPSSIRRFTTKTSSIGRVFENEVGLLFDELGIEYKKVKWGKLRPDFILADGTWVDAKLSYENPSIGQTMDKYEPHCNSLIIVFLKGPKDMIVRLSPKTVIFHVEEYIKMLPDDKQFVFRNKMNNLLA
jgi:hypothetical protein